MQSLCPPTLSFYVPSRQIVESVPPGIEGYWEWVQSVIRTNPAPLPHVAPNGSTVCSWAGPYNWTVQTYIYLRMSNVPCTLTHAIPETGIVITHSDFLPSSLGPSAQRFLVEIKPDRRLNCPLSNFVIVQSTHDPLHVGPLRFLVRSAFVPYWPQPNLIPRDPARGDRFENVCYVGNKSQFLPDLDRVEQAVESLGLKWKVPSSTQWHDYREVDAIVGVRRPNRRFNAVDLDPYRKPASKLFNAWLAGVPAVLSPDPSYQDYKRSEVDYLAARDAREIFEQLRRLARDSSLRHSMTINGLERAKEVSPNKITELWINILNKEIVPEFRIWSASPARRRWFSLARSLAPLH
jgi:hypothetical protein